ncbi:type II toxin-antitoxin system RelE/ParE family toxin [Propionivibrio sp.]|uniref:type II toxin-antitoxin system RelE/ParE family toxin n=1 Tax=Propionivibrio sp. TaxID=2212460 RepID=UPI003BF43DB5
MKPIVRRAKADADVQAAVEHLLLNAPESALPFTESLQQAYQHLQKCPNSGSPRYAHDLNLPGLEFWLCNGFPYLVFYVELSTRIEVWRILHGHRDIPESLPAEQS